MHLGQSEQLVRYSRDLPPMQQIRIPNSLCVFPDMISHALTGIGRLLPRDPVRRGFIVVFSTALVIRLLYVATYMVMYPMRPWPFFGAELRRVSRGRVIIVVPKEREYSFTFNPHLHFFPYPHSFLRHMLPVPTDAVCEQIGRDFFYTETVASGLV